MLINQNLKLKWCIKQIYSKAEQFKSYLNKLSNLQCRIFVTYFVYNMQSLVNLFDVSFIKTLLLVKLLHLVLLIFQRLTFIR